jgi:hypothetical protein
LTQRLEKVGIDRLLDLQRELPAAALAAWLADPSAT